MSEQEDKLEESEPLSVYSSETTEDGLSLTLLSTNDHLKLFAEVKLSEEYDPIKLTKKQFISLLPKDLDQRYLHENFVEDIIDKIKSGEKEVQKIANGKDSTKGKDGRIVFLVKKYEPSKERGSVTGVDPKFVKIFDNVEIDTAIARLYPPEKGRDGKDIFGKIIPSEMGDTYELDFDPESIRIEEPCEEHKYQTLFSSKAGYVDFKNDHLSVKEELLLDSNVDHVTGDIEFVGSVTINQDVMRNFSVRARHDITVKGNVVGGSLLSEHGSVTVKGDLGGAEAISQSHFDTTYISGAANISSQMIDQMAGQGRPIIRAAKNFHGNTVHDANIETAGSVFIEKELRESLVRTGAALEMPKAHLLGGHCFTVCGVEAKVFGSSAESRTVVSICSDVESTTEYAELLERINEHLNAIELLNLHLGPYAEKEIDASKLRSSHAEKMQELKNKVKLLNDSYEALEKERLEMIEQAFFNTTARVNVKKILYPGTIILVRDKHFDTEEAVNGPKTIEFFPNDESFKVIDYTEIQCAVVIAEDEEGEENENHPE